MGESGAVGGAVRGRYKFFLFWSGYAAGACDLPTKFGAPASQALLQVMSKASPAR